MNTEKYKVEYLIEEKKESKWQNKTFEKEKDAINFAKDLHKRAAKSQISSQVTVFDGSDIIWADGETIEELTQGGRDMTPCYAKRSIN